MKPEDKFMITEGVESHWNYHISHKNKASASLCGKQTMTTSIPMDNWNDTRGDIPSTYCKHCQTRYEELLRDKKMFKKFDSVVSLYRHKLSPEFVKIMEAEIWKSEKQIKVLKGL